MKQYNIHKIIIVVIVCLLLSHIISVHMYNKNKANIEKYENSSLNKINTECDCYDSINHKDKLFTPSAVNIPIDNAVFNTGHNIESNDKMKITGKYCFPIEKYLYDGVWNGIKNNITQKKQTINWNLTKHKHVDDIYCGDKLLMLPQKKMLPGDIIVDKDECAVYRPPFPQSEKCHKEGLCDEVRKTTLGEYTINGL